ncbi:hypothetical protein D3C79_1085900 [compost metagenome]
MAFGDQIIHCIIGSLEIIDFNIRHIGEIGLGRDQHHRDSHIFQQLIVLFLEYFTGEKNPVNLLLAQKLQIL